jgi:hypothetical protein
MRDLSAWFVANRKHRDGDFALGAEKFTQMLAATERVTTPLPQLEKIRSRGFRAQSGRAARGLRDIPAGKSVRACVDKAAQHKPQGGPGGGARQQLAELREASSRRRAWCRFPVQTRCRSRGAALQPRQFRLHRHSGPLREGSAFGVLHRACRIPPGRPRSSTTTCPGARICCSLPCTKCGRDTFCSSCIQTASARWSTAYSSVTPLRKAGLTMARS